MSQTRTTDRQVLDELLSDVRVAGVQGAEVLLTTPGQEAAAQVRALAMEAAPPDSKGKEPGAAELRRYYAAASELAVCAVAATLIVGDEKHPSGDRVQASRLVKVATGDGVGVLGTDLAKKALELCGLMPEDAEQDAAGEDGAQDPPD